MAKFIIYQPDGISGFLEKLYIMELFEYFSRNSFKKYIRNTLIFEKKIIGDSPCESVNYSEQSDQK